MNPIGIPRKPPGWEVICYLCVTTLVLTSGASLTHSLESHGTVGQVLLSDSWPQFRGPGGLGISDATGLPATWSAEENLAWKTGLPGAGASSPIVWGEHIFLTCYTGYGVPGEAKADITRLQRHILSVRASTGQIVWKKDIPAKLPEAPRVREHGYASSTPITDGQRLYVFFGKSGVFAFDFEGNQLWHADVGDEVHPWGSAASPVLYKDLLIINACVESQSLIALDKHTGKEKWRVKGIQESWNTPLIVTDKSGRSELILAIYGKILAFDPETGRPLWHCATDIKWYIAPSMTAGGELVFCIGGRGGVAALAVRRGGNGDVTATHRLWTSTKGSNVSSPLFHNGHLYWAHENLGTLYCAEALTGRVVYEERLSGANQFYASPVLASDKLLYVSRSGRTFVVKVGPQFELLAVNDLSDGSIFDASPAIANGRVYLRSNRFLYCVANK